MKKIVNIAVIAAGIDEEYQKNIISGINSYAKEHSCNIAHFAAFGGILSNSKHDIGEYNIYNLINFDKFDGAILLTNTISAPDVKQRIIDRTNSSKVPAVVFDSYDEQQPFCNITIDNYKAMRDIVEHVVDCHGAKKINYIAGPVANPEAAERRRAFEDVMNERGVEIDDRRIFIGDFRGSSGKKAVKAFMSSGLELPEAIICANDTMALATISSLERLGYKCPDDILVTGFDNTYNAQNYSPTLTSVERPLFKAGYSACGVIMDVLNGKEVPKVISLETTPVFTESCGCKSGVDYAGMLAYKKANYRMIEDCYNHIALLNKMTTNMTEAENTAKNAEIISEYLRSIECEKFYLCLCEDWQGKFMREFGSSYYKVEGYTKFMNVPLAWENGTASTLESFLSNDMYPVQYPNGGNVSYFLPIHFRERCLGYSVMTNSNFPLDSMLFLTWTMNISNSIENIRKLYQLNSAINELDKLYTIDPLCGIYNRNGFSRAVNTIFADCVDNHTSIMIMFADMDGLKIINDTYGHKEGDVALRMLAEAISSCCGSTEVCARFGGDEFLIFSHSKTVEEAENLKAKIMAEIANKNKTHDASYELSASIGYSISEASHQVPLFKLITKADEKMYEEKKRKRNSRYLRRT